MTTAFREGQTPIATYSLDGRSVLRARKLIRRYQPGALTALGYVAYGIALEAAILVWALPTARGGPRWWLPVGVVMAGTMMVTRPAWITTRAFTRLTGATSITVTLSTYDEGLAFDDGATATLLRWTTVTGCMRSEDDLVLVLDGNRTGPAIPLEQLPPDQVAAVLATLDSQGIGASPRIPAEHGTWVVLFIGIVALLFLGVLALGATTAKV
ncbi:MAG: hypothetical protein R2761_06805 [Acidimicrobiales bacterium]